jgi:uncharacterized protein (DUF433 family)
MAHLKIAPPEPPPFRVEEDGTVRVGKTRVTLDIVIGAYNRGDTAEDIYRKFTTLKLADIYAVLAYYLRHPMEVDAFLAERAREAEEIRRQIEEICPPDGFRERLLARWAERSKASDLA